VESGCRQDSAPFKVSKRIVFLGTLPENALGKVLKGELVERFADFG